MATEARPHLPHLSAALRETEQVTPLELFFDLVFVLAITQCTQLMSDHPTWSGLGQGLLVLAVLWWSWVGYAWLTSVIDPEEDAVRIVVFVAMAGLLLCALCVPEAFGDLGLTFAVAYGVVRYGQIGLFLIASRGDPLLRRSVRGLAISTGIGIALLIAASQLDGAAQGALWALALVLDMGGPYLFGSEGWTLSPAHFAERHGLIIIIALGESIVSIGLGVGGGLTFGQGVAAVIGVALAAALWWLYFDVVALVAARRLAEAPVGRVQNEMARDSFS
jgi:low temperature requirement protein LtrA